MKTLTLIQRLLAATVISGLLSMQPAAAGMTTGTFNVTGTMTATCSSVTTTPPSTATLVAGVAPANASGSMAFTCTNDDPLTIALNHGLNGTDGAAPTRYMCNGTCSSTTEEQYQVYSDSGYTKPWGDTLGTNTVPSTGTGGTQTIPFYVGYSSVPATDTAGSYSDTITITVTY